MVKMVSFKKSAADRDEEKTALGEGGLATVPAENEGVHVNLDHHHLKKLGVDGDLRGGDDVEFHGRGKVERSETHSGPDGDRHSATLRLHKGAIEHDLGERDRGDERGKLRGEIEKNTKAYEKEAEGKK